MSILNGGYNKKYNNTKECIGPQNIQLSPTGSQTASAFGKWGGEL